MSLYTLLSSAFGASKARARELCFSRFLCEQRLLLSVSYLMQAREASCARERISSAREEKCSRFAHERERYGASLLSRFGSLARERSSHEKRFQHKTHKQSSHRSTGAHGLCPPPYPPKKLIAHRGIHKGLCCAHEIQDTVNTSILF